MFKTISTLLFGCLVVAANPRPVPASGDYSVYMASEDLTITLTSETAYLNGTFYYRHRSAVLRGDRSVKLQVPVWIPEPSEDSVVAPFWKAFPLTGTNVYNLTKRTRKALDEALGMRVSSGDRPLSVEWFFTLTNRQEVYHRVPKGWNLEAGYCCSVFEFDFEHESDLVDKPLMLSYRQPLLRSVENREFFYLPVLKDLPKEVDADKYHISVIAGEGCHVTLSHGEQQIELTPGQKAVLSPKHHQAIRAVVNSEANHQSGANGGQPFSSDANSTPVAAASRRSP